MKWPKFDFSVCKPSLKKNHERSESFDDVHKSLSCSHKKPILRALYLDILVFS
jgi:hypothetical protein